MKGADSSVTLCIYRYSYTKNKKSRKQTKMENKLPQTERKSLKKTKQNKSKIWKKYPNSHKTSTRNNKFIKLEMSRY